MTRSCPDNNNNNNNNNGKDNDTPTQQSNRPKVLIEHHRTSGSARIRENKPFVKQLIRETLYLARILRQTILCRRSKSRKSAVYIPILHSVYVCVLYTCTSDVYILYIVMQIELCRAIHSSKNLYRRAALAALCVYIVFRKYS